MYSMQKRILIADDEADIVTMLRRFFEQQGYLVLTAGSGAETLQQVEYQPDVILLDINMPDLDGFSVCTRIRAHIACPILFLTARIEDADKVRGFAAGGDDYIVKPFSLVELGSRVQAHLRREERHAHPAQIHFMGELTIDFAQHCLFYAGTRITLTKTEFAIAALLTRHAGQVFDKERIYERVWGLEGEGDSRLVAEHVRRIRLKIAQYTERSYLETVWGCGYKWVK
jgi:DNA-binding response OmpR family regulator